MILQVSWRGDLHGKHFSKLLQQSSSNLSTLLTGVIGSLFVVSDYQWHTQMGKCPPSSKGNPSVLTHCSFLDKIKSASV